MSTINIIILTILTILCIFDTVFLILLAGALHPLIFPSAGPNRPASASSSTTLPSQEEDPAELEEAKRRFKEENKAMQDLMNYNSDVAYGIRSMD